MQTANDLQRNIIAQKPTISFVLLCVCTCKRPKMLSETLNSINNLIIPEGLRTEILIVDNDKEESAKSAFQELHSELKLPIHYYVEPNRGIANARNKVLEEAINLGASHILFFDDDELLNENCLIEHINLYNNNENALISSGPTINKFIDNLPFYITKHMVFKQKTTKKTGLVREYCAAGNVFFPLSVAKDYGLRFSNEYVFMGGEDGDFFKKASDLGFTIVWNNEAIIEEMVSKARGNIKWILRKCYYNGYAGTLLRFKNGKNPIRKFFYGLKQIFTLFLNILILLPSILLGPLIFFNVLGICYRTCGKLFATIKNNPIAFYQQIYGE